MVGMRLGGQAGRCSVCVCVCHVPLTRHNDIAKLFVQTGVFTEQHVTGQTGTNLIKTVRDTHTHTHTHATSQPQMRYIDADMHTYARARAPGFWRDQENRKQMCFLLFTCIPTRNVRYIQAYRHRGPLSAACKHARALCMHTRTTAPPVQRSTCTQYLATLSLLIPHYL